MYKNVNNIVPKIALITACYNSSSFIRRLSQSLKRQTSLEFEWICVDDGSSDDTVQILREIKADFPAQMHIVRLPINSGGGLALGVAVAIAKAPLVALMDHDDELVDVAVERAIVDWGHHSRERVLGGLFYRTYDLASNKMNGSNFDSGVYEYTYFYDCLRKHSEFWTVFNKSILKEVLTLDISEKFCLWGPILEDVASFAPFYYNGDTYLRIYHRDNPSSQTNRIRITRKTVWTYARMFRHFDMNKLRNPNRYFRLLINLMRFSKLVHGTPWYGVKLINAPSIRFVAGMIYPIYLAFYFLRSSSVEVRHVPDFDVEDLLDKLEFFSGEADAHLN